MADEDTQMVAKVKEIFNQLVTLNIVTVVGEVKIPDGWPKDGELAVASSGAKALWTRIDLLQGDITRVIHPDFAADGGRGMRDYHASSERQAMEIVKTNIETLEKIAELAIKLTRHEK